MSNFTGPAINPNTGKVEEAHFLDDYFGRHKYGVLFPSDDTIWLEAKISRPRDNRTIFEADKTIMLPLT